MSDTRSPSSVSSGRENSWLKRASIFQMVFCGMILIGFIEWISTDIRAVAESAPETSLWINPILYNISQPIGSVIAIVGAYLLLQRRKIGLYVSAISVPILLINNTWMGFIGVAVFPLINTSQLPLSELNLYFILVGIYNASIAAIAALVVVTWKVTKW